MKPFVIIVEGPQGVGKTTLTNWLRDKLPYSELMRMTGSAPIPESAQGTTGHSYHMDGLRRVKHLTDYLGCFNVIMDRSYFTEAVYAYLYKDYNQMPYLKDYCDKLQELAKNVNVVILNLCGTQEFFEQSLKRDKPDYQNVKFSAKNSMNQQNVYHAMLGMAIELCPDVKIINISIDTCTDAENVQYRTKSILHRIGIEVK